MTEQDYKEIGMEMLRCNSAEDVNKLFSMVEAFRDEDNWYFVDKKDNNFQLASNQATCPIKALVELIINGGDAVILKYLKLNGIDPKGANAPKTVEEASLYVPEPNGDGTEQVLVGYNQKKGGKDEMVTIVDRGEGKKYEDFEHFISFSKSEKRLIPFLIGYFGMGSSGVHKFCRGMRLKLIMTRHYEGGPWTWTLIKADFSNNDMTLKYFAPNGQLPYFEADQIAPFQNNKKEVNEEISIDSGTIIKLFDYNMGKKVAGSTGYGVLRGMLNENFPIPSVPYRIYTIDDGGNIIDRNEIRKMGFDPNVVKGMEFPLKKHIIGVIDLGTIQCGLGKITLRALKLDKDTPKWYLQMISRVLHTVGGQTRYKNDSLFLHHCGLGAIKNRIMIFVDGTNMEKLAIQDIFQADRERMCEGDAGDEYYEKVRHAIKENDELKQFALEVAREELESASRGSSKELDEELLKRNPELFEFYNSTGKYEIPFAAPTDGIDEGDNDYAGRKSPTFVKINTDFLNVDNEVPENGRILITGITDVENKWQMRSINPGEAFLADGRDINGAWRKSQKFSSKIEIKNGKVKISINTKDSYDPTFFDSTEVVLVMQDTTMGSPVVSEMFKLFIGPYKRPEKRPTGNLFPPRRKGKTPLETKLSQVSIVYLTENGGPVNDEEGVPVSGLEDTKSWADYANEAGGDWGFDDGGMVKEMGDQKLVVINVQNQFHWAEKSKAKTLVEKEKITKKYLFVMKTMLLDQFVTMSQSETLSEQDLDLMSRVMAKSAARTALITSNTIPNIFKEIE